MERGVLVGETGNGCIVVYWYCLPSIWNKSFRCGKPTWYSRFPSSYTPEECAQNSVRHNAVRLPLSLQRHLRSQFERKEPPNNPRPSPSNPIKSYQQHITRSIILRRVSSLFFLRGFLICSHFLQGFLWGPIWKQLAKTFIFLRVSGAVWLICNFWFLFEKLQGVVLDV